MSPVMETLTGVMIAILIFYSAVLMSKNELDINNFFFSSSNDVGYQPVRALSTLNMVYNQGLCNYKLPIIDQKYYSRFVHIKTS